MTVNAFSRLKARRRSTLLAMVVLCGLGSALPASAQVKGLEILVPAAPGGGWDQTARAMQEVLQAEQLASRIQVTNIPGAGGTIGLAQFVTSKKGKGNAVMTGGSVMMGAIITNQSAVSLDDSRRMTRKRECCGPI